MATKQRPRSDVALDDEKQTQAAEPDPRKDGPKPPFPKQEQEPPGLELEMRPEPDWGLETYRGKDRLTGKVALITGADSGIGRAVALAYAREGADVVISYLNEHPDAQVVAAAVEDAGRGALVIPGDIGDEAHCIDMVRKTIERFGKLDILVNNAAYQMEYKSIEEMPSEDMEYTFRTNIFSMFYLCKAALPHMKPGGAIINTTSIQAYKPSPTLLAYAATKGAIENFTRALAQEALEKHGVRVNGVAPGPVWTPLIVMSFDKEHVSDFGKDYAMGRPAQPVEVAPAYVFLASDEASYVAGEILSVTGGGK